MRRLLIIKFGAIGDVVMAIPAAHELHRAGFAIDWVCGAQVLPLLADYEWIRPIAADDRALFRGSTGERLRALLDLWRRIGGTHYEICATLYYDARYRLVGLPVRAKRKVMLSRNDRLRELLPGRHHTDEYLRVILGREEGPVPVGLAPVPPGGLPVHSPSQAGARQCVILVPGGARNALRSDGLRRWPLESYAAVAATLLQRGIEVVLVGGPKDTWASETFAGMGVNDRIGRGTLLETLARMDASDVVVTHDTGPLHLAGLTSAAIVSIFGPTDPRGRLPQRAGTVALWGGEGFACRPCYDGRNYAPCRNNLCVQQVTPEMVVREVAVMLEQRRSGTAPPPRVTSPESTVTAGRRPSPS